MIYYFTYFLTKILSWFYFPYKTHHAGNIPRQGAFILASNHISNLDPVVLGICSIRRLDFMAKKELFKSPMGFFFDTFRGVLDQKGESDFGAMREALRRLKEGGVVLIFVEGTRRIGNEVNKAQAGAGFLAMKSGLPVVPVFVQGTDKVMAPGTKLLKRGPVSATYGEPFFVNDASTYEEASQRILDKIYALNP